MSERLTADSVMTPDGEVVPLGPVDKDGHRVPLNTRRLYDKNGERKTVLWFVYSPCLKHWMVVPDEGQNVATSASSVSHFYLTPPDSWEKLLEDLDRGAGALDYEACAYFRKNPCECSSCIADKSRSCEQAFMRDVASRIRKLRGEDR